MMIDPALYCRPWRAPVRPSLSAARRPLLFCPIPLASARPFVSESRRSVACCPFGDRPTSPEGRVGATTPPHVTPIANTNKNLKDSVASGCHPGMLEYNRFSTFLNAFPTVSDRLNDGAPEKPRQGQRCQQWARAPGHQLTKATTVFYRASCGRPDRLHLAGPQASHQGAVLVPYVGF
ncbi:unnamed protein product [Calypogeia fissa]